MRLSKSASSPKTDPPVMTGRWTLRDHNGRWLVKHSEYQPYIGRPREVITWGDLEDAYLGTHEAVSADYAMFPEGSVTVVQVFRRAP